MTSNGRKSTEEGSRGRRRRENFNEEHRKSKRNGARDKTHFYDNCKFKENDKTFEITRHASTETSVIFS